MSATEHLRYMDCCGTQLVRSCALLLLIYLGPYEAFEYRSGFSETLVERVYDDTSICFNATSCPSTHASCGLSSALPALVSGILYQEPITTVVIIYERQSFGNAGCVSFLTLSERVAVQEYMLDTCSVANIQALLDADCDTEGAAKLHILACHLPCVQEFFYQINVHDRRYNEQGVFTYRDYWLLLADDDVTELQADLGNITHMLAVTQAFNGSVYKDACAVVTGMWLPEGRQFLSVGHIKDGRLDLHSPVYPNAEFGFNGRTFSCTTNIWFQYVKKEENNTFTGVTFELMDILQPTMNFTCLTREPCDLNWGVIVNHSWNGIVGELARKEVDIAAAPLGRTFQRAEVMDFTAAFATSYYAVMYRRSTSSYASKIDLFLRPFHWQVWLSTCAAVLVGGVCLWGVGFLAVCLGIAYPSIPGNKTRPRSSPQSRTGSPSQARASPHSAASPETQGRASPRKRLPARVWTADLPHVQYIKFQESFWFTFGSVLLQSSVERADTVPVRCLVGAWWFFSVILMATYTGNLTAVLAVEKHYPPFSTLEELAAHPVYKIGTVGSTIIVPAMESATSGIYAKMWRKLKEHVDKDPDVLSNSHEVHVEKTKTEVYAYFTELDGLSLEVSKNCSLTIMDDFFYPAFFSYGLQNNSAYKKPFDIAIYKLREAGLLDKWMMDHTPEAQCSADDGTREISLSFEDSQGIFMLLCASLLLSLLVLGVEQFYEKLKGRCRMIWSKSGISLPGVFNSQLPSAGSRATLDSPLSA